MKISRILLLLIVLCSCSSNEIESNANNTNKQESDSSYKKGIEELYLSPGQEVEFYFSAGSNGVLNENEKKGFNNLFSEVTEQLHLETSKLDVPKGGVYFWLKYNTEDTKVDIGFGANKLDYYKGFYIVRSEQPKSQIPDNDSEVVTWYMVEDELGTKITEYYDLIYR